MSRYVWRCPADAMVRREYEEHGAIPIAAALGITPPQVHRRARRLKIKTKVARGRPFQSGDSRIGEGRRLKKGSNRHAT